MALADNIISAWNCDESSGNLIDSAGSNTLTNVNTATFAAGKINNGTDLERSSTQYFTITDAAQSGLDITGDFTFNLWYKPETQPDNGDGAWFISKFAGGAQAYRFAYEVNVAGTVRTLTLETTGGLGYIRSTAVISELTNGTWWMITVASIGGLIEFYVNGASVGTAIGNSTIDNSSADFFLGCQNDTNGRIDGMLDIIALFARGVSGAEASTLYNTNVGLQFPYGGGVVIRSLPLLGVGT